ncbi:MAG TPA: hypothetical protein VH277_19015 [Gemmatimonadaceae bacterium]|nr:hypothetical protein [Gemmatimonadaceae bacterium]
MKRGALHILLLLAGALGCGGDGPGVTGSTGTAVVRFIVTNDLSAPVTVAIDDTVALILSTGGSSGLAVPPTAQWLNWTSAKPTDSVGTPIPDDIGRVAVRISGISRVAEITNVINDTTYFTAEISNPTSTRVSIGVYDGTSVSCVSVLRAASAGVAGFTKTGYYRLLARTELRAYRDPSFCTGPYVSWSASQLASLDPRSGLVRVNLTAAP